MAQADFHQSIEGIQAYTSAYHKLSAAVEQTEDEMTLIMGDTIIAKAYADDARG